jgi:NAD(P)-dependent dehydrogenase (short-subunit alcohol dehydrogenase family)
MSSPSSGQVILCTGANRSLGFAILQATALRLPSATYLLGCRSPQAGEEAVEELEKLGVKSLIEVLELDVSKDSSIFAAVETVKAKHGKLDGKISTLPPFHPQSHDLHHTYSLTYYLKYSSTTPA